MGKPKLSTENPPPGRNPSPEAKLVGLIMPPKGDDAVNELSAEVKAVCIADCLCF
jgi:hypothetical protein